MRPGHWFFPKEPDVVGLLRRQVAITIEGMDAFAAWAGGDSGTADTVRNAEHRADAAKHDLRTALRDAFVTPLEPEDVFALSRGIDWVLNHAKDAINEAEVMACPPDGAVAAMATLLAQAIRQVDAAISGLAGQDGEAMTHADAAIKSERRIERAYRAAMGALLEVDDLRAVMALAELYRRCSRMGETVVDVAERVVYAIVKEG